MCKAQIRLYESVEKKKRVAGQFAVRCIRQKRLAGLTSLKKENYGIDKYWVLAVLFILY